MKPTGDPARCAERGGKSPTRPHASSLVSAGIPSESEIACELQIEPDRLHKWTAQIAALQLGGQSVALTADRSESLDVIESAPSLNDPDPFDLCLEGERKAHLAQAIAQLSEREQLILSLYYREELTMKEIAKVVGVALSRVSQIRQAIIVKLRASLDHLEQRPCSVRFQTKEGMMSTPSQPPVDATQKSVTRINQASRKQRRGQFTAAIFVRRAGFPTKMLAR